ncbi:DEAD/DEAH box helicase [Euzebya sp.]|uniref:DEAD/DEAH box helicase n=1 Tax=Euzebya sp. TaxID=1971409 RepID=UPI003512E3D1
MSTTTTDATSSTTPSTTSPSTKTFRDFGVDDAICDALEAVGIVEPFPIQEMTLPLALSGADIIGQARTGTGKTLGFGLPMLQRVDVDGGLQVLVIVPTRELCLQVTEDLAQAGRGRGVDVLAVYGGKAIQPQIDALAEGVHVVVGTPGRLLDLSRRGVMDLSKVAGLVLDEADEMLDLGFLPDVEALVEMCADERQTLLFSATMPSQIVSLARRYMSKPTFMRAEVEEVTIAPKTQQYFFSCHRMDKPAVLARILQTPRRGLCVVFCRTKRMADTLAEELRDRDVSAQAIHSDLRQEARERALQKFRDGKITVLCATEVAARGLDIDDVTHVVNYDCPDDEKMYLHRIGRTGRAGADGVAITLAVWNELPRVEMIRRELGIEEEIHEVFSTSPLLDELFDLPAREEKAKVPSPPQARRGRGSRSGSRDGEDGGGRRGRGRRGETSETSSDESSSTGRSSEGRSSEAASSDDGDDDGIRRTRGRSRRRTRTKTVEGDTTVVELEPTEDVSTSSEDEGEGEGRTRTRRRSRGRGSDSSGQEQPTSSDDEDSSSDGSSRTRTRTRSKREGSGGTRDSEQAGGSTRAGGRSRSGDDGKSRQSKGRQSKSRSGGSEGGSDNADGRRSSKGRNSGGRSSGGRSSGGRDSGGRDSGGRDSGGRGSNGDGGGRSGRSRSDRGNGGRGGRSGRSTVDVGEARGDGKPRLSRKLEVVHLP